jgi:hypothetical protein
MLPRHVYAGTSRSVNLRGLELSPSAIERIIKHADVMPAAGMLLNMHMLAGYACEEPFTPSIFRNREPHTMLEIIGFAYTPEHVEAGKNWADEFARDMKDAEGVMEGTYINLTWEDELDLAKIYGSAFGELKAMKREFDPTDVFKYAVPQL